jgi:YggT family protein
LLAYQLKSIVDIAFEVMVWLIIARCILSFVRHNPYSPIIKFIYDVTEPVMAPFRRLLPMTSGIDFSPLIAVLALELVRGILGRLILIIF